MSSRTTKKGAFEVELELNSKEETHSMVPLDLSLSFSGSLSNFHNRKNFLDESTWKDQLQKGLKLADSIEISPSTKSELKEVMLNLAKELENMESVCSYQTKKIQALKKEKKNLEVQIAEFFRNSNIRASEETLPERKIKPELLRVTSIANYNKNTEFSKKFEQWKDRIKSSQKDLPNCKRYLVSIKGSSQGRVLYLDLEKKTLQVSNKKFQERDGKARQIQLTSLSRSLSNPLELKLYFPKKSPKTIFFQTPEQREEFIYMARFAEMFDIKPFSSPKLSIWVSTYNMGGAYSDFSKWIPPNKYDLYVIGVQESGLLESEFFKQLEELLGKNYCSIIEIDMLQLRLFISIRKSLFPFVSNIEFDKEATGIAHVLGNKGGLGASFYFQETSLCFINSHLAAHQEKVHERNKMFVEIVRGMQLGYENISFLNQFHHVIWLGDLNYRIDMALENVKQFIMNKNYQLLLEKDQLKNLIGEGECFQEFLEPSSFSFPPTFKFHSGTDDYNEKRIPSYCDRILSKSLKDGLTLTSFQCHSQIKESDHKPVSATFDLVYTPYFKMPPLSISSKPSIFISNLSLSKLFESDTLTSRDKEFRLTLFCPFVESKVVFKIKNLEELFNAELHSFTQNLEELEQAFIFVTLEDKVKFLAEGAISLRNTVQLKKDVQIQLKNCGFPMILLMASITISPGVEH